ncbi:unnamed protein product [Tilletia controversa]|nr:unnamed protein product [Tilletia controversa]
MEQHRGGSRHKPKPVEVPPEFDLSDDGEHARCRVCPNPALLLLCRIDSHLRQAGHQHRVRLPASALSMTSLTRREADLGNSSILGVESIENEDGGFNDSLEHPPATRSQNLVLAPPSNPEAIAASAAAMPTGYRSQFQRMCEGLRNVPSDAKHPPDLWTADAADSQEEGIDEEALEALLESFKSACTNSDDPEDWAPFPDKETFLVAVAALNPRAPMSVGGVQMMLTFARAVGGKNVPSYDRYLKALTALRTMSTGLKQRQGAAGNIFFTVDLHSIVARQFCNPDVRRRLHLYPRRGDVIQHFCDGDIFSAKNVDNNLPSNHVQPMVTLLSGQYAYLHEPVVLSDQRVMVPFVWWEDDEGRILGTANAFSLPIDPECLAFVEGTFTLDPELIDHKATRTLWKQIADQNVYNEQGDDISHMICMPNDLRLEWKGQLCVTLPLIMAIDDWGGGRSKKWDPHHSLLIMLAGLERSDLDQEKNIHLYGASNHATPAELVAAFTQDLQDAAGEFWDCQTNTTIWIRPYLLVVSADNPMAAELAASTGMKANFPCRVCSWGGTNAVKYTSKGVKAMAENELQNRVWAMMEAHARIAPKSILSRPKFHLLIHLGDAIRRYGPASNFATERTESFVAVQRAAVAHTNRMANSRDVAQRLVDQQLLRHLMSGGMRKSLNTGEPFTPCAAIVQVTQSPKNTVFRQRWGLQAAEKEKPKGQAEIMSTGRASATWSLSGERCEVGTFVLYDGADDGGDEDEDDTVPLSVGQIQEVVMQDRSTASVIIRHFEQHQLNKKYNMISIRSTERQVAIKPSEVIGIVNAPHDCIYSRCKIDVEGREVEQERLRTGVSKPSIIHLERGPQRRHLINHTLIRNIPLSFRPRQPQPAANPSSSKDIVKAYELGMQETIEAGAGSGGGRRKRKQKRKRKRTQEDMGDEEEEEEVVNEGAENHDVDVSEEGGEDEEDEEDLAESEPEEDEFDDMDEGY